LVGGAPEIALRIYRGLLAAVGSERLIRDCCRFEGDRLVLSSVGGIDPLSYDLSGFARVLLAGAGKASCGMALAMLGLLGERISGGLVVSKHGHGLDLAPVRVIESSHPVPDGSSLFAGESMLDFARSCRAGDLVIFLLSGGASALMEAPEPGVDFEQIGRITSRMLTAGADIHELNAVRRSLSRIKGGKLAGAFGEAQVACLVLSDVAGDDLATIGSGPLWTGGSAVDGLAVARRYGVDTLLSEIALDRFSEGGTALGRPIPHRIIGGPAQVEPALLRVVSDLGLEPSTYRRIDGEARDEAREFVEHALSLSGPTCLVATGEPVVTVRGDGKGGRCQEFACAAAEPIQGLPNVAVLAGSTDGTDGPTDAGGGLVDGRSVELAASKGRAVTESLRRSDSNGFLEACGGLIATGPTQTNVNDVFVMVRGA
jgi:glycerate-2-kinase